jgi:hypothetical protein
MFSDSYQLQYPRGLSPVGIDDVGLDVTGGDGATTTIEQGPF